MDSASSGKQGTKGGLDQVTRGVTLAALHFNPPFTVPLSSRAFLINPSLISEGWCTRVSAWS